MKKILLFSALMLLAVTFSHAQIQVQAQFPSISLDVISGRRPPSPQQLSAMQAEEAAHPNVAMAMRDIQHAIDHLNQAPPEFNGHKGNATAALQNAWIELRKALYFRLYHGG